MADEEEVPEKKAGVDFLYKTMLERDPKKRRVKPVQKHLLQIDFAGLSDSEDDSDFEVPKGSDNDSAGSDGEQDGSHGDQDEGDNDDDNDDETSDEDTESDDATIEDLEKDDEDVSLRELMERAKDSHTGSLTPSLDGSKEHRKMKVLVCCVCLADRNEENDEIVECDNCGVLVHEGCYGIGESESVASTESSASTEPWFCEACKAGVDNPTCELCPNLGGIFKETDTGRWVHIVCALYVPGVAFGDVDRLTNVTLFEMSYSKWGAKECYLCEDERFSKTGMCIGCDAGMCRNYFHVTCAQREGLLSEATSDEDIADPFYAYCRLHADKLIVRVKKRNWLAIQSFNKNRQENPSVSGKEELRVQRKLNRHRRKFQEAKALRDPPWTPPEKWPRFINSCASAVRRLIRKAELLGINSQLSSHTVDRSEVRKKPFVNPALSVDFVAYFLERNSKMTTMKTHLKELLIQNGTLREQEKILRGKYDQLSHDVNSLTGSNKELVHVGEKMWKLLGDLAGKKLPLPDVLKPKKPVKAQVKKPVVPRSPPAVIHQCGLCHKTTDQHQLAKCDMCRLFYHLGCLDPPLTRMPKKTKLQGWQCSECAKRSSDDEGEGTTDPNAPRRLREKINLPKKFIHQIQTNERAKMKKSRRARKGLGRRKLNVSKRKREADTVDHSDEGDAAHKAQQPQQRRRRKRRLVKKPAVEDDDDSRGPTPGEDGDNDEDHHDDEDEAMVKKMKSEEVVKDEDEAKGVDEEEEGCDLTEDVEDEPVLKKEKTIYTYSRRKPEPALEACSTCSMQGTKADMVRCDKCHRCYHFRCLDPPLKKTPKRKGYDWHCEECDDPDETEEETLMDTEETVESDHAEEMEMKEGASRIISDDDSD